MIKNPFFFHFERNYKKIEGFWFEYNIEMIGEINPDEIISKYFDANIVENVYLGKDQDRVRCCYLSSKKIKGGSRYFATTTSILTYQIIDMTRIYGNSDVKSDYDFRVVVKDTYEGEYLRDENDGLYNFTV